MFKFIFFILFTISLPLSASVNIQNGNYSELFKDAAEGNNLEIDRFYNSHSFVSGMFGFGWGSVLETKLISINGMLVMVEEIPGGARNHYIPEKGNNLSVIVDKIIIAAQKDKQKQSQLYYEKLKHTLLTDITMLVEFSKRYNLQGEIPDNTLMRSIETKSDTIQKIAGGYLRTRLALGIKDKFDNDGKLMFRQYQNGDFIKINYDRYGKIQEVRDKIGRSIKFVLNDKGLVEKAFLYNKKVALYKYDTRGDLIESKDVAGNTYTYKYDPYHNLIDINNKIIMKYDPNSDKIVYQKTEDGWETFIEYSDNDTGNEFYEAISVIRRFGKEVHSEKYEIWKRPKPDGTRYVYKSKEKKGNNVKSIIFTMCCGTPMVVNDNGKVTRYEYDEKSRLKRKVFSTGRIINIKYNEKGLISYIVTNGNTYAFKYDAKGQIVYAGNKDLKFKIEYDNKGRFAKFYDNKKRAYSFKYDEKNRLRQISSKDGSMIFNPDATDENKVINKGVKDTAWEIRKVWQDYNDLMSVFQMLEIEK